MPDEAVRSHPLGPHEVRPAIAGRRIIKHFDFNEVPLGNFGSLPLFWQRHVATGFPLYLEGRFDHDTGRTSPPSLRLDLDGGSLGYRYLGRDIAIRTDSEYLVVGWVRTQGLRNARAYLTASWLDRKGDSIPGTERRSEPAGGTSSLGLWTPITISMGEPDRGARYIGMGVWLSQAPVWTAPAAGYPGPTVAVPEDVAATAWFDDLTVYRLPRVSLATTREGNVFGPNEPVVLRALVRDPDAAGLEAVLRISDADGELVDERPLPIEVSGGPHHPQRVSPEHQYDLPTGWYEADLAVSTGSTVLIRRTLRLVRLAPPVGAADTRGRGFGLILWNEEATPETLAAQKALLRHLAVEYVKLPLPDAGSQSSPNRPANVPEPHGALPVSWNASGPAAPGIPAFVPQGPDPRIELIRTAGARPVGILPEVRSQISNLRSQISDLRFQNSNLTPQASDFKSQISDPKSQISDLRFQIPNPGPQLSNARSPDPGARSQIKTPASSDLHQASSIHESLWSRYAGQIAIWQFGFDADTPEQTANRIPRLPGLRAGMPGGEAVLAVPGSLESITELADAEKVQAMQLDLLSISIPSTLPPDDMAIRISRLKSAVSDLRVSSPEAGAATGRTSQRLWLHIQPLPADAHPRLVRVGDLARRLAEACFHGAEAVFLDAVWDGPWARLAGPAHPREDFIIFRTVSDVLAGAAPVCRTWLDADAHCLVFERGGQGILLAWDASAPPEGREHVLPLGPAAEELDIWGRRASLESAGELRRVRIDPIPKFIINTSARLVALRAGFHLEADVLEAGGEFQECRVFLTNPYPHPIGGQVRLHVPLRGEIQPEQFQFSLESGEMLRQAVALRFPVNAESGIHTLIGAVSLDGREESPLLAPAWFELGLRDVDVEVGVQRVGEQLVIVQTVLNRGQEPLGLERFVISPAGTQRRLEDFRPGRATAAEFTLGRATTLSGQQIRIGLREIQGYRVWNQVVTVP